MKDVQDSIDYTEDGIAIAFTNLNCNTMRYDLDQGRWFEWTDDQRKADNSHLAYSYCRDIARELSETLQDR